MFNEDETPLSVRDKILSSAILCYEKSGYFETTMREIARAARLSEDVVMEMYNSKDEILSDFVEQRNTRLIALLDKLDNPQAQAPDRIHLICRTTLDFLSSHTGITSIWFEFYRHNVSKVLLREFFWEVRQRIANIVKVGIEEGSIRPLPEPQIVDALMALTEGTLILGRLEGRTDMALRMEANWDIFAQGFMTDTTEQIAPQVKSA